MIDDGRISLDLAVDLPRPAAPLEIAALEGLILRDLSKLPPYVRPKPSLPPKRVGETLQALERFLSPASPPGIF